MTPERTSPAHRRIGAYIFAASAVASFAAAFIVDFLDAKIFGLAFGGIVAGIYLTGLAVYLLLTRR